MHHRRRHKLLGLFLFAGGFALANAGIGIGGGNSNDNIDGSGGGATKSPTATSPTLKPNGKAPTPKPTPPTREPTGYPTTTTPPSQNSPTLFLPGQPRPSTDDDSISQPTPEPTRFSERGREEEDDLGGGFRRKKKKNTGLIPDSPNPGQSRYPISDNGQLGQIMGNLWQQVGQLGNPNYKPPSPKTSGVRPYFPFTPPVNEASPTQKKTKKRKSPFPNSVYPTTSVTSAKYKRSVDLVLALDVSQVL